MTFITDFADQAVMLPLAVAICVVLLAQGWRRGAAAWALAVSLTFAAMLVLKLMFLMCSHVFSAVDIRTPSGHVAAATVVAGGLATLLIRHRITVLLLALLAAVVIGTSRLALGEHSLPEVVLGALVGLIGAIGLLGLAGPPPVGLNVRRIGLVAFAVVVLCHGLHLPAEAHIRAAAMRAARLFAICQAH